MSLFPKKNECLAINSIKYNMKGAKTMNGHGEGRIREVDIHEYQ